MPFLLPLQRLARPTRKNLRRDISRITGPKATLNWLSETFLRLAVAIDYRE
jgi:hypothetical protein